LDEDDSFLPAFTKRGAARSGTFGNVHRVNWLDTPTYDHDAGGLVRLRVVNTDTTRTYKLHLEGAEARIIAWDGHPVEFDVAMPGKDAPLLIGPGQRVDFAVSMPEGEEKTVDLMAKLPGQPHRAMARLRAVGQSQARDLRELRALPANPVAKPDLANAEMHEFVFGWTPEGGIPNNGFCGSLGFNFWSINRKPWPGDAAQDVGPLATLEMGKSYVLRLRNESPNTHPIHLHGLVFRPIRSNRRQLPPV